MNDKELKERFKELDDQKRIINLEITKIQNEMRENSNLKFKEDTNHYVGKCFTSSSSTSAKYPELRTFKILDIGKDRHSPSNCVCIEENSICRKRLLLFSSDPMRMIEHEEDLKTIDKFSEISEEEFRELFRKTVESILDGAIK